MTGQVQPRRRLSTIFSNIKQDFRSMHGRVENDQAESRELQSSLKQRSEVTAVGVWSQVGPKASFQPTESKQNIQKHQAAEHQLNATWRYLVLAGVGEV